MDLSIIIPSFNTRELLDRCLASIQTNLEHASISYEIIVVDNASTDGTQNFLSKKYARVIKILNKKNLGYGSANNMGIQQSHGTYILLLNSDIDVQNNAIESLYRFGLHHQRAFIGAKLFNEDHSPQPSCGPMYTLPVVFVMLFLKGDELGMSRYSPNEPSSVDWVSGACLFGKKSSFEDAGLFDEEIFMYMEEIEFLYRAKKKGYDVLFYPGAAFVHVGAASSSSRKTPVANIYEGLLYFYSKHRSIMEQTVLRFFLRVKSRVAQQVGAIIGNNVLVQTYEHAEALIA